MSNYSPLPPSAPVADTKRVPERPKRPALAGNTATGTLKLIALLFMLIDHLGAVVFTQAPSMRIQGRIAFPIYCWCMIVGFNYTRSVPKYLARILLTGIISQPLYAYVMNHMGSSGILWQDLFLTKPNIFLTLFLGLAGLWGIREKKWGSHLWAPVVVIALATVLKVDYGWKGVLFILLLYAVRTSKSAIAALMIAFFLYWGTSYSLTSTLFGRALDYSWMPNWLYQPVSAFLRLETYGLLSLPFILIPSRRNIQLPTWAYYLIYPAHLVIVWIAKLIWVH